MNNKKLWLKKNILREIQKKDDLEVEALIRGCLIECGADHEGTAWADPDLCRFSEIYNTEGNKYWVAVDIDGRILCGAGIGCLDEKRGICELQKMYCLPCARGSGVSHAIMRLALEYARQYYRFCYLETCENMIAAQRFYEKYGFVRVDKPVIATEHFACEVKYLKEL